MPCSSCRFRGDMKDPGQIGQDFHICRRFPPSPQGLLQGGNTQGFQSLFPIIPGDPSQIECGEYAPLTASPAAAN